MTNILPPYELKSRFLTNSVAPLTHYIAENKLVCIFVTFYLHGNNELKKGPILLKEFLDSSGDFS